ncbi:integrase core domain-containing protein [Sphaerisporangium sp. NPDC051017]|uniref:integrase core domain-containing protein n=1 Tax=Sphaerisporangium sp. NPDC051017 TaxID=3154636 RepID=UPI00341AE52E
MLDALDMALWRRSRTGHSAGLVHHSDAGSQYTWFAFTAHLSRAGIDASVGTVGDALDNALMESAIGLYKTELIKPVGPWRDLPQVEPAIAERVEWYSVQRLHTAIGRVPPNEYEADYYTHHQPHQAVTAQMISLHQSRGASVNSGPESLAAFHSAVTNALAGFNMEHR